MAFDIDALDVLDTNFDTEVDATDLQSYELANHGTYSIDDIDHDMIMDKFDLDINNDSFIDKYQSDLDNNNLIDQFEQSIGNTSVNYDANHDSNIDFIDQALLKSII
jgi:hypothetical protein